MWHQICIAILALLTGLGSATGGGNDGDVNGNSETTLCDIYQRSSYDVLQSVSITELVLFVILNDKVYELPLDEDGSPDLNRTGADNGRSIEWWLHPQFQYPGCGTGNPRLKWLNVFRSPHHIFRHYFFQDGSEAFFVDSHRESIPRRFVIGAGDGPYVAITDAQGRAGYMLYPPDDNVNAGFRMDNFQLNGQARRRRSAAAIQSMGPSAQATLVVAADQGHFNWLDDSFQKSVLARPQLGFVAAGGSVVHIWDVDQRRVLIFPYVRLHDGARFQVSTIAMDKYFVCPANLVADTGNIRMTVIMAVILFFAVAVMLLCFRLVCCSKAAAPNNPVAGVGPPKPLMVSAVSDSAVTESSALVGGSSFQSSSNADSSAAVSNAMAKNSTVVNMNPLPSHSGAQSDPGDILSAVQPPSTFVSLKGDPRRMSLRKLTDLVKV